MLFEDSEAFVHFLCPVALAPGGDPKCAVFSINGPGNKNRRLVDAPDMKAALNFPHPSIPMARFRPLIFAGDSMRGHYHHWR